MTLIAVTVGVMAGAWACAASMSAGHAHHTGDSTAMAAALDHTSGHAAGHADAIPSSDSTTADSTTSHSSRSSGPSVSYTAMSCVVGVDLRVRDLAVTTVCGDLPPVLPTRPVDHANEPEPPVPRFS